MAFWLCLIASISLVAFGQPAWIGGFGLLAAAFGYACFWAAMLQLPNRGRRFVFAFVWYVCVQGVQLSWMATTHYMGPLILGVYAFLILGLGVQFGLLSLLLRPKQQVRQIDALGIAGAWVIFEWIRIFFLSGFTWNPAGLAFGASSYAIQLASIVGIYGLSFWVIWTNIAALNAFFLEKTRKNVVIWALLALFPYGFGLANQSIVKSFSSKKELFNVALIETGLLVEEKYREKNRPEAFIPALTQWERIWSVLKVDKKLDLIVLPEAALPYSAYTPYCRMEQLKARWEKRFGPGSSRSFPQLKDPYAHPYEWKGEERWMATNAFLAQALANEMQASVIIGLDVDVAEKRYNAAFLFHPGEESPERYEKRILAPVGEYVPLKEFGWIAEFLAKNFGIEDSFDVGAEAKVFSAPIPLGIVICLEETFSGVVRELRQKGAKLLISLSNDVWFPKSRLAQQHYDHGRMRAVENGVFLIRSSNMGVTGGLDCFGEPFGALSMPGKSPGAVYLSLPLYSYSTLYSLWGDTGILSLSSIALLLSLYFKKKLPLNGSLG